MAVGGNPDRTGSVIVGSSYGISNKALENKESEDRKGPLILF